MELKDEDIKKALECCSTKLLSKCLECKITKNGCAEFLASQALALINRQQAEIERLQNTLDDVLDREPLLVERAEKYAIKEFAEKVKNYVKTHCNPYGKPIFDYDTSLKILKYLDNLKAEMAGGENA